MACLAEYAIYSAINKNKLAEWNCLYDFHSAFYYKPEKNPILTET